jgi:hypothetical protein
MHPEDFDNLLKDQATDFAIQKYVKRHWPRQEEISRFTYSRKQKEFCDTYVEAVRNFDIDGLAPRQKDLGPKLQKHFFSARLDEIEKSELKIMCKTKLSCVR